MAALRYRHRGARVSYRDGHRPFFYIFLIFFLYFEYPLLLAVDGSICCQFEVLLLRDLYSLDPVAFQYSSQMAKKRR